MSRATDIILPIPPEFDYLYEDIYPLSSGGFLCMMCNADTHDSDWTKLEHKEWCSYNHLDSRHKPLTHGECRAAYERSKEL